MRKVVNGKVIDIDNIEIFDLASRGMALQKVTLSNTGDGIDKSLNVPEVRKYINLYDIFFNSLPYPLYAIESPIKYSALGTFIKMASKRQIGMWIDDGLNILINNTTGAVLKIVNNSWSLEYTHKKEKDNTSMDIYKNSPGYKEYQWVLGRVSKNYPTSNFYQQFMPEFLKACNNDLNIVRHELKNILTFASIPARADLKRDRIVDIDNEKEYYIDIYCSGEIETGETTQTWNLLDGANEISSAKRNTIKTYEFKGYTKPTMGLGEKDSEPQQCNLPGLRTIFMVLCEAKEALKSEKFPEYEGILSGVHLVFTINNGIFITKLNRMAVPKGVARGVELYAVNDNKIYYTQKQKIGDNAFKNIMYSYNIIDTKTTVCKISYN